MSGVEEYKRRLRAACAEVGWPKVQLVDHGNGDIGITYEPGMPDDLPRQAHAVAQGINPRDYRPCAWCYSLGDGDACAEGRCSAPVEVDR